MEEYRTLAGKNRITKDGETYKDLLSGYWNRTLNIKGRPIIVNEHYVARPDLISLAAYGDDSYADVICKVNGISNPFELAEDMMIYIPDIEYVKEVMHGTSPESDIIADAAAEHIKETDTAYRVQKSSKRSPNQQTVGESRYVIDRTLGVVFY